MSYKIKFISEAQPRIVQIILLQPSLDLIYIYKNQLKI